MAVAAIDLGGTSIKLGIVDNGKLMASDQIEARADSTIEHNLADVTEKLKKILDGKKISYQQLTGIGIAFPGIVDVDHNKVISRYIKYKGADEFDFNTWAKVEWKIPVAVENDARAALLGEWKYGAGKGYENIVMLTLGTGLGSAVLLEGKLLRGSHFIGGNLWGHISINLKGATCNCGYIGCLETEASSWVLSQKAEKHSQFKHSKLSGAGALNFSHLFEIAEKDDPLAKELVEESLHAWGICAVNVVHAYDPEIIIFGGSIMQRGSIIIPFIQKMIDKYAWLPEKSTKLVQAELPQWASLTGLEYILTNK